MRVYEDRMDLLRAVIVGAYGTPYQDGLFFFDFHLPPEYPDVPPVRNAHSGFLNSLLCLSSLSLFALTHLWKQEKEKKKKTLAMFSDLACYAAVSLLSLWWVADKSESIRGGKSVS